jgi:hypothetical protein
MACTDSTSVIEEEVGAWKMGVLPLYLNKRIYLMQMSVTCCSAYSWMKHMLSQMKLSWGQEE